MNTRKKGLILISLTAFLWSTSGFFIKYMTIGAFQISFWRSLIAAVTIYLICLARGNKVIFKFDHISILASVSYAGILIFFVLATKMTTAANAIFLQFTAPVYLVILEPLVMKTKFDRRNIIAILVCLCGMLLFFYGRLELGSLYGNFIAIASGICFAVFSLLLKYKREIQKSSDTLGLVVTGNFLVAIISLIIIFPHTAVSPKHMMILLYMGAIQIGISYMIFNAGIKYVSATESMIIATLEAIFNPIWVFIGLGEIPGIYSVIGGMIILTAILWRSFWVREKTFIIE